MSLLNSPRTDYVLAVLLTCIGAVLSWYLVKGLPFIGIDDAAITRSYAENLANGAGYVYNVGGERVEGSTAFLWVSLLTVLYAVTDTPEMAIIGLCLVLTAMAMFFLLRVTRQGAELLSINAGSAVLILSVLLIAAPGYFLWTVWTMMEVALWSMLLIALVLCLSTALERPEKSRLWVVCLLAFLLPLTRPEGIVFTIGLLVFAAVLSPRSWRPMAAGLISAVLSFVMVTGFRLAYFGQPFPNTFYAKVSSDRLQGIRDGLKYLVDFVTGLPFAELYLVCILGAVAWAFMQIRARTPGHLSLLIVSATCVGALLAYAVLGGDHFALWRFYQPVVPLMLVPLTLGLAAITSKAVPKGGWDFRFVALTVPLVVFAINAMHYYQARFDVQKEFILVAQGIEFGEYLNEAEPRPTIGTGPAGGIALSYDGEILDLLGLNWTVMAHANPVKVGMRNHASFHKPTFWEHAPDLMATFNRPCAENGGLSFYATNDDAFDDLFTDQDFREAYQPVVFEQGRKCWPGFASNEWLAEANVPGMSVFDWASVEIIN